jgi:hypothetical protein
MSQRNVESVIGRIVTDEAFRERFSEDPGFVLRAVTEAGIELTPLEMQALARLDMRLVHRLAEAIDPRIQKVALHGVRPGGPQP